MKRLLAALLLMPGLALAQSVTISVTPTSGIESVTPRITWTSTGVVSCTATGSWSGTKATSGSEVLPAIDRSATYGLICRTATGGAVLTWTAPTQNTNGTPLTDLAKFRVYMADTVQNLGSVTPVEVGAAVRTHTFQTLPEGIKYFAVTAVNSRDVESVFSNTADKTITSTQVQDSATAEVVPRPKPPAVSAQ